MSFIILQCNAITHELLKKIPILISRSTFKKFINHILIKSACFKRQNRGNDPKDTINIYISSNMKIVLAQSTL